MHQLHSPNSAFAVFVIITAISAHTNILMVFQPNPQVRWWSEEPGALQSSVIYTTALEVLKNAFSPCPNDVQNQRTN